ncbi:hypothetical protein [Streptomyces sp. NBC_01538]|uniref:hypothetical protein n=1 Tax=Streptomyces sp. NBC_01538 TaxID=2903897 RepID=UPI003867F3F0
MNGIDRRSLLRAGLGTAGAGTLATEHVVAIAKLDDAAAAELGPLVVGGGARGGWGRTVGRRGVGAAAASGIWQSG